MHGYGRSKRMGIWFKLLNSFVHGSISCIVDDFKAVLFLHSDISDEIKISFFLV